MNPKAPVDWEQLAPVRPEPTCETVFESHRDDVASAATLEAAVSSLYEAYHDEYDADERVPDQGAAFVFAYLVERAGVASFADEAGADSVEPVAIAERKPDPSELERLFWEEEAVPWWLAVRFGVHYSLVIYWLWEADIPLMRRNIPDATLQRIDGGDEGEDRR